MKVSLDVSAVPVAPAGAGRYVLELARALAERDDQELVVLTRREDDVRWSGVINASEATGTARVERGRDRVLGVAPRARPLRLAWEQARLPGLLRRLGPDVHHGPHYTMPERSETPVVVTVHDCTFFDHPEWHERTKVLVFRRAIRVAARRASVIVCVSETTARHLSSLCAVAGEVVVAPHGVDHERFSPQEPAPGADARVLSELGLDSARPLVVFVGTVEPRKNVASLVRAFAEVADVERESLLVVAGQRGWRGAALDDAIAASRRHGDRTRWLGYVPDVAVPALLRRASVVAYPSFTEGFGLPALEALACGAPLVTTQGSAMAELASGAAVLVPPSDVDALAEALLGLVQKSAEEPEMVERRKLGIAVAASRTWSASADAHVRAYRLAAGA